MLSRDEPLAQLAEHLTFNQGARGSNPRWLTKKIPLTMRLEGFFVMSEKISESYLSNRFLTPQGRLYFI